MIKDINPPLVEGVAVAILKERGEQGEEWNVYLINLKKETIENVLVTSTGYGMSDDETIKTSTLRHFLNTIPKNSYKKIEPINENLFGLNNEFWVSFLSAICCSIKNLFFWPKP